jgi:hypothetical protein
MAKVQAETNLAASDGLKPDDGSVCPLSFDFVPSLW